MNNTPTIIAIETATPACSVALIHEEQVFERYEIGSNIHSQVLLNMVNSVLLEAKLEKNLIDAVAVGRGPGSFTGLRIGIGVAQGLAYGINRPMIGVSSLDILANQSPDDGVILAGLDARMGEIYWANYLKEGDKLRRLDRICVSHPTEVVLKSENQTILVGNAWIEYKQQFNDDVLNAVKHLDQIIYPDAVSLLKLAKIKFESQDLILAKDFVPQYIRDNVAKKSLKQ